MAKLLPSNKVYISQSQMKNVGRGVFAKTNIKKGEIIESCPVIEMPINDTSVLGESFLVNYFYFLGPKKEKIVLALGYGSIYNHTEAPNALYTPHLKERLLNFEAIRDIKKGEEITVNYAPQRDKDSPPLWFDILS